MGVGRGFFSFIFSTTKATNMSTHPSDFVPDFTRRDQLEAFVGTICVNTTGRLGIVTHVEVIGDSWRCAGFGLDGNGVWTSAHPTIIAEAEDFYNTLKTRFGGALSWNQRVVDIAPVLAVIELLREDLNDHLSILNSPSEVENRADPTITS